MFNKLIHITCIIIFPLAMFIFAAFPSLIMIPIIFGLWIGIIVTRK
jgi:hypothetical protein